MNRKKVYLKAYFRRNIGDDMFVETIVRRYPRVNFCAYARRVDLPLLIKQRNLTLVPTCKLLVDRLVRKLTGVKPSTNRFEKHADATVHIGGSIFIEPTQFQKPRSFFYPDNMFYIGCNFGPYKTDAYRTFIETRLRCATDVCFRDTASRDEFAHLDSVRVAPDVLFGYPYYPPKQKGIGIGISVIDMKTRSDLKDVADGYERSIAALIDECAERAIPVTLFSFCDEEGDVETINRIASLSKTKAFECCEYQGDILAFLERFNACEYVLATRFHAMIIAWSLGKKVLPIIYSNKQTTVLNDVDYDGDIWDVKQTAYYDAESLLAHLTQSCALDNVQILVNDSQKQFSALDSFVNT